MSIGEYIRDREIPLVSGGKHLWHSEHHQMAALVPQTVVALVSRVRQGQCPISDGRCNGQGDTLDSLNDNA